MQYIIQLYGDIVCPCDWFVEGVFDYFRFYYIKGGEATYYDADGSFPLEHGNLYIFPNNVHYKITHNPGNPLDVLWFHVNLFPIRSIEAAKIEIAREKLPGLLIQSLELAVDSSNSVLDKLFGALLDVIYPLLKIDRIERADVLGICEYISNNLDKPLVNKQLADMLGYSEKYFIRMFTKTVGIQPHKYVINVRLSHAVKLIFEGKPVKEMASLLGYCSAANFSRDFKSRYKLSPSEYVLNCSGRP